TIGWRALLPLWLAGNQLLAIKRFDLIYITTANYPLFMLGRLWRRRFGTPYILDLHDPPYRESSNRPSWAQPRLKHRVNSAISKRVEAQFITAAQGLVSVSPNYINEIRRRHEVRRPAWLSPGRSSVIPFSAFPQDLREAAAGIVTKTNKEGPPYLIVYVG